MCLVQILKRHILISCTNPEPSSPPENVMASPLSSHSLQVSWHPLSKEQAHGLIKGYKVFLERTDFDLVGKQVKGLLELNLENKQEYNCFCSLDTGEPPLLKIATTENLIVSGLSKYKNYSIQVQAFTTAGDGPLSPPAYCLTLEDCKNFDPIINRKCFLHFCFMYLYSARQSSFH
jgi:hypothetical protein